MSSTNKTTNYELSQFLGTDKPAWLSDYNTDMSKIDAQMKLNADGVTTATGSASTANTSIGTLANLTTDAKTDLVSAINEVDSHADTAQNSANSASDTANANTITINNLISYLNLQSTGGNLTITTNSGTIVAPSVKSAKNTDGTLGKIYGKFIINNPTASTTIITISDTGLRPTENINIDGLISLVAYTSSGISYVTSTSLTIKTDGTAQINITGGAGFDHADIFMPPCVLFMQNFGD